MLPDDICGDSGLVPGRYGAFPSLISVGLLMGSPPRTPTIVHLSTIFLPLLVFSLKKILHFFCPFSSFFFSEHALFHLLLPQNIPWLDLGSSPSDTILHNVHVNFKKNSVMLNCMVKGLPPSGPVGYAS